MKYNYKHEYNLTSQLDRILSTPSRSTDNPVIKASQTWITLSKQLKELLDETVYNKWFERTVPLVLTNNILILQSPNQFSANWINSHYQELVNTLMSFQDKKVSVYFIPPETN